MHRVPPKSQLPAWLAMTGVVLSAMALWASDAPVAPTRVVKDTVCQSTNAPGKDCHSPGSRAEALKTYLAEQEKLAAAQTKTNGLKDCDKPPSRAELLKKAALEKK